MKYIVIKADENDADYITEVSQITDEQIEKIRPVIQALKEFEQTEEQWHNWPTGEGANELHNPSLIYEDKLSIHQINLFDSFVPEGDHNYPGIHTIKSVKIMELVEELL